MLHVCAVPRGLCSHTVAIQTIPAIFIFLFSLPHHHQSNTLAALAAGNQVEMMHLAPDDLHIIINENKFNLNFLQYHSNSPQEHWNNPQSGLSAYHWDCHGNTE